MKSITRQKPFEEIEDQFRGLEHVFIVGCGTCATVTATGGQEQVAQMKDRLEASGKLVTGWKVIPIACDQMAEATMEENRQGLDYADCILVMACALGVQRLASTVKQPVIPALDTLFIGVEDSPGDFREVCSQCGRCVLGQTAGICPLTECHKGLLNGPCGGTNNGKCEVDGEKDCAWTLIYRRLAEQGRLDLMRAYRAPRDFNVMPRPRTMKVALDQ